MAKIQKEVEWWGTTPGDTIRESLEFCYIPISSFAKKMGLSIQEAEHLFKGDMVLTEAMAVQLQDILGIDKQFWINREKNYRDGLAKGLKKFDDI